MDLVNAKGPFTNKLREHIEGTLFHTANEREISRAVVKSLRDICKGMVISCRGDLWYYSGVKKVWRKFPQSMLSGVIWEFDGAPVGSTSRLVLTAKKVQSITSAILSDLDVLEEDYFDARPIGVPFRDSFVVVSKQGIDVRGHCEAWRCTELLPIDYDPDANCPKFNKFLENIWAGDPDIVDKKEALRRFLGVCLAGASPQFRRCALFVGAGANGKSLLTTILAHCFPYETRASIPPKNWNGFRLAGLDGKLVNIVPELPVSRMVDTEVFKSVTAGDPLEADRKHKSPIRFTPRAGHIFSTNELPASEDTSAGFWGRFLLFTFNRNFENDENRRNPREIEEEICEELPGIVNWALKGAVIALQENRLIEPPSHHSALHGWQHSVDQVQAFFDTRCEPRGESFVETGYLYERFLKWAEGNGHRGMSRQRFSQRLKKHASEVRVRMDDGSRPRGFQLSVLNDGEDDREMAWQ